MRRWYVKKIKGINLMKEKIKNNKLLINNEKELDKKTEKIVDINKDACQLWKLSLRTAGQ